MCLLARTALPNSPFERIENKTKFVLVSAAQANLPSDPRLPSPNASNSPSPLAGVFFRRLETQAGEPATIWHPTQRMFAQRPPCFPGFPAGAKLY